MVGIITRKETIKEKGNRLLFPAIPENDYLFSRNLILFASDSAACLSTTTVPHEYFYQTRL